METVSTEVTSIQRRNDIEKSTWKTHRYFVDFESRIHVNISTSNRCHNLHVDLPFKINVNLTNFPRGISTSNRWRIDEGVSIGRKRLVFHSIHCRNDWLAASDLFHMLALPIKFYTFHYQYRCLKNEIHQIDSKNGWLLLSASLRQNLC